MVELKLLQRKSNINSSQEIVEFTDRSMPIVKYSFTEHEDKWFNLLPLTSG
jgi:molybdopterin synthase catalytic subunit